VNSLFSMCCRRIVPGLPQYSANGFYLNNILYPFRHYNRMRSSPGPTLSKTCLADLLVGQPHKFWLDYSPPHFGGRRSFLRCVSRGGPPLKSCHTDDFLQSFSPQVPFITFSPPPPPLPPCSRRSAKLFGSPLWFSPINKQFS